MYILFEDISNMLYCDTVMRSKGDKATPWHNGSMNDQISLKDCIMRDNIDKEKDAEMICDITEKIHCKYYMY